MHVLSPITPSSKKSHVKLYVSIVKNLQVPTQGQPSDLASLQF